MKLYTEDGDSSGAQSVRWDIICRSCVTSNIYICIGSIIGYAIYMPSRNQMSLIIPVNKFPSNKSIDTSHESAVHGGLNGTVVTVWLWWCRKNSIACLIVITCSGTVRLHKVQFIAFILLFWLISSWQLKVLSHSLHIKQSHFLLSEKSCC